MKKKNTNTQNGHDRLLEKILGQTSFNLSSLEDIIRRIVTEEVKREITKQFNNCLVDSSIIIKAKEIETTPEKISASIRNLDISVRTKNALIRGGFEYIDDLFDTDSRLKERELARTRNLGVGSLSELKLALTSYLPAPNKQESANVS